MMNFISFTGGVLIAVLMVGAMFIMYSCLNSYQIRMMEQIRKTKNKVYDLEQKLDNQGECWPAISTIARDLKLSPSTVRRALRDLRKAGVIESEQRYRDNGGKSSLLYKLDAQ